MILFYAIFAQPFNLTTILESPILEQIPLTVSSALHLPTIPTLSYAYKTMPSSLAASIIDTPPSSTGPTTMTASQKPAYIRAPNGQTAAHPSDAARSCRELLSMLDKQQETASMDVRAWEDALTRKELEEKRRVAPGWLDRDERLLQPQRTETQTTMVQTATQDVDHSSLYSQGAKQQQQQQQQAEAQSGDETIDDAGEQLDRAFGQ